MKALHNGVLTMSDSLLIIIASGNREKVLTALMFAKNTIKYGWISEVRVIFFGPAENLLVSDSDVKVSAVELATYGTPVACKFLSDRDAISEHIESIGVEVDYVGAMIADLIKDGYVPMVW